MRDVVSKKYIFLGFFDNYLEISKKRFFFTCSTKWIMNEYIDFYFIDI